MPTTVRTHPWLVGGLAALAAAATVGVLALAGTFDTSDTPRSTAPTPVVVVTPSSGSIDQANANRLERQLQHGAVGAGAATQTGGFTYEGLRGDTKGDIPSSKPANELGHGAAGYQNGNEAGAGH
jgi:hypothetical protein